MKIDGISAIAIILIASFAIDRIVTGLLFILGFFKPWVRYFPDPATLETEAKAAAERKQKLAYFGLSGLLGIVLLSGYGKLRIFSVSGFPDVPAWLDTVITGLILVGGADRVAAFLNVGGPFGASKPAHQPIEISGKITLEDNGASKKITIN
ncbi:MAG TPA: hypothetical protein VNH44_02115 [Micropepsaceae bacterium]|nr:hypothetical protein [Micropepsaceae bacterium]